jgi:hypothetical protein
MRSTSCLDLPVLQQLNQEDMQIDIISTNDIPYYIPSTSVSNNNRQVFSGRKNNHVVAYARVNACKPSRKRQGGRSDSSGCEQHVPAWKAGAMSCHFHMPPTSHYWPRQNCHDTQTPNAPAHLALTLNLKADILPCRNHSLITCYNLPG